MTYFERVRCAGRVDTHRDRRTFGSCLINYLLPVLIVLFAILRVFIYQPVEVAQNSMEPTLHEGDRLLVNTWETRNELPERGSIIVLQHPQESHWVVKRVVGLPGDWVSPTPHGIWRNGEAIEEPYARPYPEERFDLRQVKPDHVYVLGDNRPQSEDSRDYGQVPESMIIGTVKAVMWPPEHARWLGPNE